MSDETHDPGDQPRRRLLIVDDNNIIRKLVITLLRSLDYDLVEAVDGEDALAKVGAQDFDLVVLDIMMPGINGLEVARRLREDPRTEDLPIVFCTAVGDRKTVLDAAHLGRVDYVVKPLNRGVLLEKISGFLDGTASSDDEKTATGSDQEPVNEGVT